MADKWKHLDAAKLASMMLPDKFITEDDYYHLHNNPSLSPIERVRKLMFEILPTKGGVSKVIMAFHKYLWNAEYIELAREFHQRGS